MNIDSSKYFKAFLTYFYFYCHKSLIESQSMVTKLEISFIFREVLSLLGKFTTVETLLSEQLGSSLKEYDSHFAFGWMFNFVDALCTWLMTPFGEKKIKIFRFNSELFNKRCIFWSVTNHIRCRLANLLFGNVWLKTGSDRCLSALDCLHNLYECLIESALGPFVSFSEGNKKVIFQNLSVFLDKFAYMIFIYGRFAYTTFTIWLLCPHNLYHMTSFLLFLFLYI